MSEHKDPVYDRKDTLKYCSVKMKTSPRAKVSDVGSMHEMALDPNCHTVFATCHGGIMSISDRYILAVPDESLVDTYEGSSKEAYEHGVAAYRGVDFITLPKSDAEAIIRMFWDMCKKLGDDGDGKDPLLKLFPEDGISFERLIDRVEGRMYPAAAIIRCREDFNNQPGRNGIE